MNIRKLKHNYKNKICYIAFSDEILIKSNIKLINLAKKIGKVYVGVLSDKAINEYKTSPDLNFDQRLFIAKNLKNVDKVLVQNHRDYSDILYKIKPDYVIHKKNFWNKGIQKYTRNKILKILKKWSGQLLEVQVSSEKDIALFNTKSGSDTKLKRLIETKKIIRILEAHNPLSALIVDKVKHINKNSIDEFDALWCSSLADSSLRGKPDNQSVDLSVRVDALNSIMEVTKKPIFFDADNGGPVEQIPYLIRNLERMGVGAIVIEDKVGPKINSLFENQSISKQDSKIKFCEKIKLISRNIQEGNLQIVARIESLILNKGIDDAISRANAYSKAGANMILIHSKSKKPDEIYKFARRFKKSKFYKPLVCVPSTYSNTHERSLEKNGFKVVIYANQLLRSIYPAMLATAKSILKYKMSGKAERNISSVKEIISLIN